MLFRSQRGTTSLSLTDLTTRLRSSGSRLPRADVASALATIELRHNAGDRGPAIVPIMYDPEAERVYDESA